MKGKTTGDAVAERERRPQTVEEEHVATVQEDARPRLRPIAVEDPIAEPVLVLDLGEQLSDGLGLHERLLRSRPSLEMKQEPHLHADAHPPALTVFGRSPSTRALTSRTRPSMRRTTTGMSRDPMRSEETSKETSHPGPRTRS